jgi:RimJ/RimL family protein N-acetyltransferase
MHQGKGLARAAMNHLPPFVQQHFPHAVGIVLTVHEDNLLAQHVYHNAGFRDDGEKIAGRNGFEHVMYLPLYDLEG